MKKLVNKRNILIVVIMFLLGLGLVFILVLSDKKDSALNNKTYENTQEKPIDNVSTTENTEETKIVEEESTKITSTDEKKKEVNNVDKTSKSTQVNQTSIKNNTTKSNIVTTIKTSESVSSTTIKTEKTLSQENNDFRNQLLSKYGVIVGYKDEVDGVYKNSYASPRKIYDDEVISYNLTKIEDALKKYPKSFFSEIKNKWKPISIYLVDYINGYAGGVTDNNNSSTLVILIVATHSPKSSILENTVHHELMHAIDCYFTSKGIYSSYTLEQSIAKYNPEGFSYGIQDNKYVYLLDNPYYFVSKYAKSAYNEDRAEIFSNLMYRSTAPAYLKAGQPINEKAKVITNQINQNFTSASSGNNRWDKLVAH